MWEEVILIKFLVLMACIYFAMQCNLCTMCICVKCYAVLGSASFWFNMSPLISFSSSSSSMSSETSPDILFVERNKHCWGKLHQRKCFKRTIYKIPPPSSSCWELISRPNILAPIFIAYLWSKKMQKNSLKMTDMKVEQWAMSISFKLHPKPNTYSSCSDLSRIWI